MDIIGAIGYSGQDFVMLEQDTFGYITGKGICIVSIATGPKEMIWRTETGISRIASHRLSHRIAIVPELARYDVEVIDLLGVDAVISLRNPSSAKIVDVDFSRDGEHIFAISSSLNPKVFAWNLKTRQLIFMSDLPVNLVKITVCPADRTKFALSGDEGLYLGSIVEIMGVSTVKYDKIILDSAESVINDKDPVRSRSGAAPRALLTSITFAVWAPFNRLFIGTKGGVIGEVDSLDLILRIRALIPTVETTEELLSNQVRCIPLCATISSSTLLVGTSSGAVLWYPIIDMDSSYATVEEGTLSQPIQNAQFEGAVCCLQTDFMYVTVLAGTSSGSLMKFQLDVAEIKIDDGDDDVADIADSEAFGSLLCDLNQTINATRISVLQPGAVLCCESFSLPVLSSSDASLKTSVLYCPIFMTGSHSGVLTFWKQPSVDSEPIRKVII
jgi:WD40 repeat protein